MNTQKILSPLNSELIAEILENSGTVEIDKNTEVMREGQYIKAIPIVTGGLIKVYMKHDEKELLLYYIRPGETCIMSFDAVLKNAPSKVYASTEENSSVLLLPVDKVMSWLKKYPDMNSLFFSQYNHRYNELIYMIGEILFGTMEQRLQKYLRTKVEILEKNPVKISHRKIANDLGSAREVISRLMKKLENDGKIKQLSNGIEIF